MAASTYEEALARLLAHEGGYSNHPSDPGGPTNFGITLADYRRYAKRNATAADIRTMKIGEAKAIYRSRYWDALACDELPAGVDYAVFDYGVNSGIGRSAKVLQRAVGVTPDGVVGPHSLAAVVKRDAKMLVDGICDERLRFLRSLGTWPVFGRGWSRRVAEVRAFSLQLADGAPAASAPRVAPLEPVAAKGIVPPPKAIKAFITKGAPAAGAVGGFGFWDWVIAHPYETAAIVLVGIGVLGGAVYALNRWHDARQEAPTPGLVPVPSS
jgi:lysozyme family protein